MSIVLAVRRSSGVERRLQHVGMGVRDDRAVARVVGRLVPMTRRADGAGADALAVTKVAIALAGALLGVSIAAMTGWSAIVPAALGYAGFVLPSIVVERREAQARRDAARAAVSVVEWLHAIVGSGRPVEAALERVTGHASGSRLLDACLEQVRRDYTLGVPLHVALARNGAEARISAIVDLADRVERSRDLGRGVLRLLQDQRDELRAGERAAALEAASHVEGKLTLVLTLCYLPALALLVIIPLFLTLLSGLFGT
jgi:pilus assembly protein TadC